MANISESEITFRPYGGPDVVVRNPEELAESGVQIHRDFITATWGPDALTRYQQARQERFTRSLGMPVERPGVNQ